MEYLKKNDPERAKKFRHVLRFIDDLIAMNDQDEFSKSFREIYPQEMEVKEENTTKAPHTSILIVKLKTKQLLASYLTSGMRLKFFPSLECPIFVAIFHLKCFIQL